MSSSHADDAVLTEVRSLVAAGKPVPADKAEALLHALDTALDATTPAEPGAERTADRLAIADGWD